LQDENQKNCCSRDCSNNRGFAWGYLFYWKFANSCSNINPTILQSPTSTSSPADYVGFESLQFTNVNSNIKPEGGYTVNLQIKNTGPATAKFDNTTILLNGKKITAVIGAISTFSQATLITNASATGTITLPSNGFTSGMKVEVTIQTIPKSLQFSQEIILP
jgi:hypothetical protein